MSGRGALEGLAAVVVVVVIGFMGETAWAAYDSSIRSPQPFFRETPTPVVRIDDAAGRRRFQQVKNLLGEAETYRAERRQDWADSTLQRALALDPYNVEALAMQARWAMEPAPELTAADLEQRELERRVEALVSEATALIGAGDEEAAEPLLEAALALDPACRPAAELLARLH